MKKQVCIHGHFYQPPRENAWLEQIEQQDSAHPFHDWNERINYECYEPNSASRILGGHGKITEIVNNYRKISFNFGPTLMKWLEFEAHDTYQAILTADQKSQQDNNGHGNAIAQAYSHMIMPLANQRDKITQVKWGIFDFQYHFKRMPEGMWLPETAVDTETLEVLADHNIKFTILAPRQAQRIRHLEADEWQDVSQENIDTRRPYLCQLPSGQSINIFIYDGNISQEIAFNGLLDDGEKFSQRLLQDFDDHDEPQLVHIATDGETYGHHHRMGEMGLSFCINKIEESQNAELTNYANYLEQFPPEYEIEMIENSSWSCVHGVERWRSNCGCQTGGHPGWTQEWREPLRNSLDWLRDELAGLFEKEMAAYTNDQRTLRDRYIEVIYNREEAEVTKFLKEFIEAEKVDEEKTRIIRLLEMQRHAMLMYTSCGWFFDEISRIETVQIMQYAARAIQLAETVSQVKLEAAFLEKLQAAPSNIPELGNGAEVYKKMVQPQRLTLSKVGMHYAVVALFSPEPEQMDVFNYRAESEVFDRIEAGVLRLALAKIKVHSMITYSEKWYTFAALYLGQQHIIGSVSDDMDSEAFDKLFDTLRDTFQHDSLANTLTVMEQYFGAEKFSLRSLFKDEQRKVLNQIIEADLELAEDSYRKIYDRNYNILSILKNEDIPLPTLLRKNLEIVINSRLNRYFEQNQRSTRKLQSLTREVKKWDIALDIADHKFVASQHIHYFMLQLEQDPGNAELMQLIMKKLDYIHTLDIPLDLYQSQNIYFNIGRNYFLKMNELSIDNQELAHLTNTFLQLGDKIHVDFSGKLEKRWEEV